MTAHRCAGLFGERSFGFGGRDVAAGLVEPAWLNQSTHSAWQVVVMPRVEVRWKRRVFDLTGIACSGGAIAAGRGPQLNCREPGGNAEETCLVWPG